MTLLAENLLSPSFSIMADVVHIVTAKDPIRFLAKLTARVLRMRQLQATIYRDNAYADAQHQTAFVEMAAAE